MEKPPRSEARRRGEASIVTPLEPRLADVIARRRERAAVRDGYISLILRVACIALAVWLLLSFCFLLTQARGQDMAPALKDGDLCMVYRTGLLRLMGDRINVNDVIVYQSGGVRRIGRVAANPGDTVEISESGVLTVNGLVKTGDITEPTDAGESLKYPYRVPEGCLFVLGDHRSGATDSRNLGPIPLDSVEGRVISILRRRGL